MEEGQRRAWEWYKSSVRDRSARPAAKSARTAPDVSSNDQPYWISRVLYIPVVLFIICHDQFSRTFYEGTLRGGAGPQGSSLMSSFQKSGESILEEGSWKLYPKNYNILENSHGALCADFKTNLQNFVQIETYFLMDFLNLTPS